MAHQKLLALLAVISVSILVQISGFAAVSKYQLLASNTVTATSPREAFGVMPRAKFKALVLKKKQQEILKLVGKPADSTDDAFGISWRFTNRTLDPITGKLDSNSFIHFDANGMVDVVNFIP